MTYQMTDMPARLDDLSHAAGSTGAPPAIADHDEPERLVAIAIAIAAELPAAAVRLGAGRTGEAMSAAIGLGVAVDGAIAGPTGHGPQRETVAQLAADLAGRVGLLLLDAAIEAAAIETSGDAGRPAADRSHRAEQAVQALLDGIDAIRGRPGYIAAERCTA